MRLVLAVITILFMAAATLYSAFIYINIKLKSPLPIDSEIIYTIPKGQSLTHLESDLSQKQILPAPYLFRFAYHGLKNQDPIQAGQYKITPDLSAYDLLTLFQTGPNYFIPLTIPEGKTSYEIIQIINQASDLSGPPITDIPAEGSLLPETYHITPNTPRSQLISDMKRAMTDLLENEWQNRSKNLPLSSAQDALILASIIEKETAAPGEHATVAGVFINRLNKNMLLQTDPTVIYAINGGKHENQGQGPLGRRLLRKDLKIDSPYNTYLYAGLPPGPITNPGAQSIKAALHPENHQYLYFVADGTGGHAFAKTLTQHNRNVANWRKVREK